MAEWDRDRERYEPERDLRRDYIRPGLGYGAAHLRHGRSGEFSGGVWSTTVGGRPRRMHGDPDRAPQGPHAGKGPRGYRRPDARILEDVSDALTADPDVDASDVEVTVEAGEVTLAGTVPERSMRWLAEEVVSRCAGVKDVQNRLRLSPPRAPA